MLPLARRWHKPVYVSKVGTRFPPTTLPPVIPPSVSPASSVSPSFSLVLSFSPGCKMCHWLMRAATPRPSRVSFAKVNVFNFAEARRPPLLQMNEQRDGT